ncbi:hypothetical protein [Stieleria sp.]|uniref:hypothetical protein n=1 Tax=Stieleria sp. TaxID=2795976 RepID=UPI00356A0740
MDPQQTIRDLIAKHSPKGRLNAAGVKAIAELTWRCEVTYSDVFAVGGSKLRHDVWRSENDVAKAEIRKQWKTKGTVVIDRLGVEMA